jgi:hypothetical protein
LKVDHLLTPHRETIRVRLILATELTLSAGSSQCDQLFVNRLPVEYLLMN